MSGTISIASATIAFIIYHFMSHSAGFENRILRRHGEAVSAIRHVLYKRWLGALVYGLAPFLIILLVFRRPLTHYGFAGGNLLRSILWWFPVAVVVVFLSYISARSEKNLALYPQIRVNEWNRGLLVISALSWIVYLAGYEFLFRGYLLFSCLESFGFWPAIVINLCLYSLFHIHKGPREAVGSIFFGFLLCYLTLHLGSFWFAIFIHVTMALSNEWFSIGFQPEMNLIRQNHRK